MHRKGTGSAVRMAGSPELARGRKVLEKEFGKFGKVYSWISRPVYCRSVVNLEI